MQEHIQQDLVSGLLDAALAYAARGLPVFPCVPRGKEPAIARGFYAATTNPETIRRFWRQSRSQRRNPDRPDLRVLGSGHRRRRGRGKPARARGAARRTAGDARSDQRRRRPASLVCLHRTDPLDGRPDCSRHRCALRRRLCRRAAEHPRERPRLCLVGRHGRPTGRRAGMADRARAAEAGALDLGAGDRRQPRRRVDPHPAAMGRQHSGTRSRRSPPRPPAVATTRSTARPSRCFNSLPAASSTATR